MKARSIYVFPLLAALLGCGSGEKKAEVAATVNGEDITMAEVQKVARNFQKQGVPADPEAQGGTPEEKLYYTAVSRLVEQRLLVDAAVKAGLTVTDAEVEESMNQLVNMAGGVENYQAMLAEQGITEADVRKDMSNNLLLRAYLDKVKASAPGLGDADLKQYFDAHPEVFGPQPEVHARHILVMVAEGASEMERAAAKQTVAQAQAQIQAGASFEKLAGEISQDPGSGPQGGDLGWFGRGRMVAPFDSAAFALEPGQLSGIVETQFGYHLIKVEEKRTTPARDFEEVKESIRRILGQEQSQTLWRSTIDELKAASKPEIQPPTPAILDSLAA